MDASKSAVLRSLRILLIILTLYSVLQWKPAAAQDAGLSEAGLAIANAINQVRVENGLQPLAVHPLLNQAAQGHVNDMLSNYIYGHYGSDGSTVHMRVARTGYSDKPWVSENWVSSGSPSGAMRWWMNDYIHRVNILTPRWQQVGIGVGTRGSEMIFVTVFSAGEGAEGQAVSLEVPAEPPSVRIEQVTVPAEGLDYTIQPGDTLLAIGLRYGMPWEDVAAANGLDERSLLQIGQVLRIPGNGEAAVAAAPVPDVPTEPYTVQPGDTLFSIAAHRGMSWQELAAINQMGEHSLLQIDQEIKVPASEPEVVEMLATETTGPETTGTQANGTEANGEAPADGNVPQDAAVKIATEAPPSDTNELPTDQPGNEVATEEDARLAALAAIPVTAPGESTNLADTSAASISSENGTLASVSTASEQTASVDSAGVSPESASDEVALASVASVASVSAASPASAQAASTGASGGGEFYTIAEGDTLFTVAVDQGLDWQQLMALNNMDEDSILQPGQEIRLR